MIEPNWKSVTESLATLTAAELAAERDHWRAALRVLEAMPAHAQSGHGVLAAHLRLVERALLACAK